VGAVGEPGEAMGGSTPVRSAWRNTAPSGRRAASVLHSTKTTAMKTPTVKCGEVFRRRLEVTRNVMFWSQAVHDVFHGLLASNKGDPCTSTLPWKIKCTNSKNCEKKCNDREIAHSRKPYPS
jgi:hypothetical protein